MIDIGNISKEYLEQLIFEIDDEISNISNREYKTYTLDDFKEKSIDEIFDVLNSYNMENAMDFSKKIYEYFSSESYFSGVKSFFKKSNAKRLEKATKIIDKFNECVLDYQINNDVKIKQLESEKEFLDTLFNFLYSDENIESKDLDAICEFILNSDLSDDMKFELSFKMASILIENDKVSKTLELDSFEEGLSEIFSDSLGQEEEIVEIYEEDKIEDVVEIQESEDEEVDKFESDVVLKYFNQYRNFFLNYNVKNTTDLLDFFNDDNKLKEIIESDVVSEENFYMILSTILFRLNNNDKRSELYNMYLEMIDAKYGYVGSDSYTQILGELTEFVDKISKFVLDVEGQLNFNDEKVFDMFNEYQEVISRIKREIKINILSKERINEIVKIINDIELNLNNVLIKEDKKKEKVDSVNKQVPIKSFVLFDYYKSPSDGSLVPYILSDLDVKNPRKFIDRSITGKVLKSGFRDFNMLIDDLIVLGKPQYLEAADSSISNQSSVVLDRIYYKTGTKKFTGMLRIRPTRLSVLRFCEQTITFKANTVALAQVDGILSKYLPNIKINSEENFEVYVNFVSGFKHAERDLYDCCIDRKDNKKSLLVKLFIDEFNGKTELTKKECELFEQLVVLTLDTLEKLEKKDNRFKFDIVRKMGGAKNNEK